ncbi:hypothetical protein N9D31_04315, partial [Oligoflexaceae bacterium]|nr:hypothetical protein [Oligoflexaceae bacterium]
MGWYVTEAEQKISNNETAERIFLAACCAAALFLSVLLITDTTFFYSSYGALSRDSALLAEVVKNDNDVRYSPSHLPIWEDSYPEQSLFRKDKIFTESESTSTINFNEGSSITVEENSLVIIDEFEGAPAVNLLKGSLSTRVGRSSDALRILRNGKKVDLFGRDSLVQVFADGRIQAIGAGVSLNADGQLIKLAKGQTHGEKAPDSIDLAVRSVWQGSSNQSEFNWKDASQQTAFGYRIEISRESTFQDPRTIRRTVDSPQLVVTQLKTGTYYWRVRPEYKDGPAPEWSAVESFSITAPPKPAAPKEPAAPKALTTLKSSPYATANKPVTLTARWGATASKFEVELSKSKSFTGPPVSIK